jgi:hypothetical protein
MFEKKANSVVDYAMQLLGFEPMMLYETETIAPNAFTYSLFYVYYDQYTYIRGVLFQNVFLGLACILFALQFLTSIGISALITLCVFLVFFELMGCMWMLNAVMGGYPI